MLYAELDSFEPVAIHEHETGDGWRVFFRSRAQRDGARRALASEFENALELSAIDVEDEDWARRSQAALRAVRAGRIVVAPPWDVPSDRDILTDENASRQPPTASSGPIVIVIDPSTGFGTGHHATTRLCLELLQEIQLSGKRVIDVGTGSGVLAIAASMLGASGVLAIDNDPDALQNARENVARNAVTLEVEQADLESIDAPPADLVLANLTSAVLQRFAGSLTRMATPGGLFIVSGFGPDDVDEVAKALGVEPRRILRDGDWAAVLGAPRLSRSAGRSR